jgi:hypothetical protein
MDRSSRLCAEAEFLDETQTKLLTVFLLAIHSHLQLSVEIYISSNSHNRVYSFYSSLLYTVKEKGGKPDKKPCHLPYGLRNPYRPLKSENSQDYAQKSQ